MAVVNFFMDASTGNDLNPGIGGTGSTATTPGTNDYTSTSGNFDGTSVFTPTDGSTPASSIAVGDYVSLYNSGETVCRCVAKVVTVAAGVNGAVTIDTTIKYGTVPTSNSGSRNLKHGGPWASFLIGSSFGAFSTGTVPQSTQANIKVGTYAYAANARGWGIAGTATAPMIVSGYKALINDQDTNLLAVAGTDIPANTWTSSVFTSGGAFIAYRNLSFSSASTGAATVTLNGGTSTTSNCQITATGANALSLAVTNGTATIMHIGSYFNATSSAKCSNLNTQTSFCGCYFKGGLNAATTTTSTALIFAYCVFDSQAGDSVSFTTGTAHFIGNSFYAGVGNGILWTGTPGALVLVANNYFENYNQASKAAINNNSGTNTSVLKLVGNAYFNCTSTVLGLGDYPEFFSGGTLATVGFVSGSTQNFSPLAPLQNVGFPASISTLTGFTNNLAPGAIQAAHANRSRSFSGF